MNQIDGNQRRTDRTLKKPYFCQKCQRFHFYGVIWDKHQKYAREPQPFIKDEIEWVEGPETWGR